VRDEAATPVELAQSSTGHFTARGPLIFGTATSARQAGLTAFGASGASAIEVDCSGITSSDSAGMTVLLDWLSFAKHSGRSMHFASLPEQVQAIARISDALELLEKGV
jgi:phospholipid transport system transporter-binding protein